MQENISGVSPIFFLMLTVFFTLGSVASDIYVPSLPALKAYFHTTVSMLQWSMSSYMLGFSLSQFIYGPLGDQYGRRQVGLYGLLIGLIGSVIAVMAISPFMLIIGRLIQGIGFGVGTTLGRAIMRDLFSGADLSKYGSLLGIGNTIMIGSAPVVGGYFQHYLGWRSVFVFMLVYTCLIFCLIYFILRETRFNHKISSFCFKSIFSNYYQLLRNRVFIGYTICAMAVFAGCLGFYVWSPFLLQTVVGLNSAQYGFSLLFISFCFILGSIINIYSVHKVGVNNMLKIGALIIMLSGIVMLIPFLFGIINLYVIIIPAMIFAIGGTFIFANAFAGAFSPFPEMAGSVGAVYGGLQILGGFISASLLSLMHYHHQAPIGCLYFLVGLIIFIALTQLAMPKEKQLNLIEVSG